MSEEQTKDNFWVYVGIAAFLSIAVLLMVKKSENDKFAPIKEQLEEETRLMNIRVLD